MGFGGKILSRLFGTEDDFSALELDEGLEEEFEWDWDHIVEERHLFKMSDEVQRDKYIRSLVEQIKDASVELEKLSAEYNLVTAMLKDMDEIDALPASEKLSLQDAARNILYYEDEARDYEAKRSAMTEAQFRSMERFEDSMPKAYEDMEEAERYKGLIKDDLRKLEGEKHAYLYRQDELKTEISNLRGMTIICVFAAVLCVIMLLVLQFGFNMDTGIGYIFTCLTAAVVITLLYVRYLDSTKELKRIEKGINRLILLQNTVKIRYVNNTNLLDYLYTKYNTKNAKELKKVWEMYELERDERERAKLNEKELTFYQAELLHKLRKYQLNDVYAWLHNPLAIIEHNEMVELRHAHILQRQKLRARMDYNKRIAKDGQNELKEFVRQYPEYAGEALNMVERYS
ncbi:MAG: hypothetical protein K5868_08555 [Lachnospiraceae bacterium]|nr:hypothetical protein [Lachnospiraceae bacterium]